MLVDNTLTADAPVVACARVSQTHTDSTVRQAHNLTAGMPECYRHHSLTTNVPVVAWASVSQAAQSVKDLILTHVQPCLTTCDC